MTCISKSSSTNTWTTNQRNDVFFRCTTSTQWSPSLLKAILRKNQSHPQVSPTDAIKQCPIPSRLLIRKVMDHSTFWLQQFLSQCPSTEAKNQERSHLSPSPAGITFKSKPKLRHLHTQIPPSQSLDIALNGGDFFRYAQKHALTNLALTWVACFIGRLNIHPWGQRGKVQVRCWPFMLLTLVQCQHNC